MAARLTMLARRPRLGRFQMASRVALDVQTDRTGNFFEIAQPSSDDAKPPHSPESAAATSRCRLPLARRVPDVEMRCAGYLLVSDVFNCVGQIFLGVDVLLVAAFPIYDVASRRSTWIGVSKSWPIASPKLRAICSQ